MPLSTERVYKRKKDGGDNRTVHEIIQMDIMADQ